MKNTKNRKINIGNLRIKNKLFSEEPKNIINKFWINKNYLLFKKLCVIPLK
jgi:hypothetical protein